MGIRDRVQPHEVEVHARSITASSPVDERKSRAAGDVQRIVLGRLEESATAAWPGR